MTIKQLTFNISTVLIFIGIIPVFADSGYSLSIHKEISDLAEAKSPVFIDNQILFTYFESDKYIRRVAIAFDSDNYSKIYPFRKNKKNVFFFVRKIPVNLQSIKYRLIVDGIWMNDPNNSNMVIGFDNFLISSLDIPKKYAKEIISPLIETNKNVSFVYRDKANKNVYLSGNFNNWDPFMFKMKEDREHPGTYKISLRLSPGIHYYKFIADGVSVQDPKNPKKAYNSRGNAVSVIKIN